MKDLINQLLRGVVIGVANIIGMFGLKPPTKDLSVTAGLALMSIVLIQMANIHHN